MLYLRLNKNELKEEPVQKEDKADAIIDVAQKRFAIFGAEKTSMREIADDLRISKAALYYYFPDKENLYKAVIEKELNEFLATLEKDVRENPDPDAFLRRYALNRLSYFRYLVNLGKIGPASLNEVKPLIFECFINFREKEKKILMEVLEKGRKSGSFNIENTEETASLYLEILRGLRSIFLSQRKLHIINDDEFSELSNIIEKASDIFIRGLMYKE
jgi:TetR/AcrR family transcriptional regulator